MNFNDPRVVESIALQIQGRVVAKINPALLNGFQNGDLVKIVIVPGKLANIVSRKRIKGKKVSRIREFDLTCLGGNWRWIDHSKKTL